MKKALIIVGVVVLLFGMGCAGLIVFVLRPFYDPWRVSEYQTAGSDSPAYSAELLARYPQYSLCDALFSSHLRGDVQEVYDVAGPFTLNIIARAPLSNQSTLRLDGVAVTSSLGNEYNVISDGVMPATISLKPTAYHNAAPGSEHLIGTWKAPIAIDAAPELGEVITAVVRVSCVENGDIIGTGTIEFLFEPVTKSGPVRLP